MPRKEIKWKEVNNNGISYYRVIVPKDLLEGNSRRRFFKTQGEADDFIKELNKTRGDIVGQFLRLSKPDQLKVLQALSDVDGNASALAEAAAQWRLIKIKPVKKKIGDVVAECLTAKEQAKMRDGYLKSLKCSLTNFKSGVGVEFIHEVTPKHVSDWLNGNGWEPTTRKGYLTDVRTLFSFAIAMKYCPENPALSIQKPVIDTAPPGIHTVEKVAQLLKCCLENDPGLLGYVCPVYFGGVRPEESEQLHDKLIHDGLIEITPEIAKRTQRRSNRHRRFIEINPTLKAWLDVKGVELGPKNLVRRLRHIRWILSGKQTKKKNPNDKRKNAAVIKIYTTFPWPHDVLRHTFCSYALPKFGAKDTARWAGNTEEVIFSHYRERVKPVDVDKFWNLLPDTVTKD